MHLLLKRNFFKNSNLNLLKKYNKRLFLYFSMQELDCLTSLLMT